MTEKKAERHEFRAEVKRLMNIVVNSLYTDKEIFVRELVSNASDALERLRYMQLTEKEIYDEKLPLEIEITTNAEEGSVSFADYGTGMSRKELVENLGTIARSGSRSFVDALGDAATDGGKLIGQFGVGFYSCFMVADSVEIATRGCRKNSEHLVWRSSGDGTFEISKGKGHRRGTRVTVRLKEEEREYSDAERIREILRKYSAFVPFPLKLDGEQINTTEAVWLRDRDGITDQEYGGFYRFHSNSFDDPSYRLHFSSEAPVDMNVLLFVPGDNVERLGMGRTDPGVSLYSRRVLIDQSPKGLLPEWARFLRGVVDSADIPLNISRETMQDSSLLRKLGSTVTKRFIRFLDETAGEDPEGYGDFYRKFGLFIKEGVASDFENRERLEKLLRFESSGAEGGALVSFDDYVSRMPERQEEIYYLFGRGRDSLEGGPHMEFFSSRGVEVLFVYEPIDEFVMSTLGEYGGKKIVSADGADVDLGGEDTEKSSAATSEEEKSLCGWMKEVLGDRVGDVRVSRRLVESPAAAFNSDSSMTHGMKRIINRLGGDSEVRPAVRLEINGSHSLIRNLGSMREKDPELAATIAEQLFDNAVLAAGYMENPGSMVGRMNSLLERLASV